MLIAAQHGQSVLQRERSNPRIIGRDWGALLLESDTKCRIGRGGLVGDGQDLEVPQLRLQPLLVRGTVPGLRNAVPKLSEHDHWNARSRLMTQQLSDRIIAVDEG